MKNKAFTLIEVMMALIVVSIMLAVLAPTITTSKVNTSADIKVIDTTPVGVIVAWWGTNYPDGWIPVNGQSISEPEYEPLRKALGDVDTLPNLNGYANSYSSTTWIIKAKR